MITLTILLVSLVCAALALIVGGVGMLAVLGDVLIAIGVVALIVKLFKK